MNKEKSKTETAVSTGDRKSLLEAYSDLNEMNLGVPNMRTLEKYLRKQ